MIQNLQKEVNDMLEQIIMDELNILKDFADHSVRKHLKNVEDITPIVETLKDLDFGTISVDIQSNPTAMRILKTYLFNIISKGLNSGEKFDIIRNQINVHVVTFCMGYKSALKPLNPVS